MNQQNLDYLKDNLRYMGFGDKLNCDLENNIRQGFPEFVLNMQSEFSSKKMDTALSFRKGDQSDLYFFNRFDAHLHHPSDAAKDLRQTFYLNKGHGVTLKEAFNLLEGRAVHKELPGKEEKYHAWIQLDFKEREENGNYKTRQYHQNYGYDLEASLKAFPIKELQNEQQKERLLLSLQKGNMQSVTMTANGKEQLFFVEANPQYKTINVYDGHLKLLAKEQRTALVQGEAKTITPSNGGTQQDSPKLTPPSMDGKAEGLKTSEVPKEANKVKKGTQAKKEAVKKLLPKNGEDKAVKGLKV